MSLKTFGISMVGIFVPAYLYDLGFSLSSILLYFLWREVMELTLVLPVSSLTARLGSRIVISLGCVLAAITTYLLFQASNTPEIIYFIAALEGAAISFFFIPYHQIFSKNITKKSRGAQVSLMDIMISIVSALGPLIGGIAAQRIGITNVFLIALVIITLAVIPLSQARSLTDKHRIRYRDLRRIPHSHLISSAGFGITEMAATIIWPLFIFIIVKNYAALGLIVSVSLLLSLILIHILGRLIDKGSSNTFVRVGAKGSAVIHLGRAFMTSYPLVTSFNIAGDIAHTLFRIPWCARFYDQANHYNRVTYIAAMELATCVGRLVFWAIMLICLLYASDSATLFLGFILGAIGSLYVPRINTVSK